MAKDRILLNLSGHPLKTNPKGYLAIDIQIPNADMSNRASILDAVKTVLALPYKDHLDTLMKGDYEVIFQGMSTLALVTCCVLHGISGHFPKIRWNYKDEKTGDFKLSEAWDLQKIRVDSRDARFFGHLP